MVHRLKPLGKENQNKDVRKELPKEKRKDFPNGYIENFKFRGGVQIRNK